jgi:cobalamin biosynthetic protein CobC
MPPAPASAAFQRHGGRLAAAQARFPEAPQPWLDLSTGINPRPYPAPRASALARARLPDPEQLAALETAAAAAFGAQPAQVVAVPGSETAIRLLPALLGARRVAIGEPTYGAHAEAWAAAGAELGCAPEAAEAWVVVNPNNPDGRITPAAALLASAERRWTVVDEAFADCDPALSVAARAGGRLVVLRSFGKFYGLAGLRLGFVVADEALAARLRRLLGDWPVSAEAIAAGLAAYPDRDWAERTRARLARDAARLRDLLAGAGLQPLGGCPLFQLAGSREAGTVFERLARHGVLTRPFPDGERLRFGLPGRARDWSRLAAGLAGDRR